MEKIASFNADHTKIMSGIYISRVDGDITTYDLRTRKPNTDELMSNAAMHSVEHLFATLVRNSEIADNIIYFGPMGCQTGFYLLVRGVASAKVVDVIKAVLTAIINYDGEMPGYSDFECGNYKNLDVGIAKRECESFYKIVGHLSDVMEYPA